jgi:radical SAM protein with 4Fe4S-binding SPASM domain
MPCPFPWQYLVVQWNGDVVPCCRDYDAVNRVGNARETTLKEIWNGPELREFRSAMAEARYGNELCAECMEIYSADESQGDE